MSPTYLARTAPAILLALAGAVHAQNAAPALDTIAITVQEGTVLSADVARDGRIVFDLLGQLWLLPPGGGAARALTDAVADVAEDQDPAFSPDGSRVVFTGERGGRMGIWLLDIASGRIEQLVQHPDPDSWAGHPAWAPDGGTIAFARAFPEDTAAGRRTPRIALLDLATRAVRVLPVSGGPAGGWSGPAWSPDGARIAFVAGAGAGRIWIVPASGGTATPLTTEAARASAPTFAPDGRRIAYLAPDSADRLQVWVQGVPERALLVNAPGTGAARVTDEAELASTRVRWTPDGRALLYSAAGRLRTVAAGGVAAGDVPLAAAGGVAASDVPFSAHVAIVRPRRSLPPVQLPEPGAARAARGFMGLALSPDARSIGVLALSKLWVIPVHGGEPRAVADVPPTARHVAWSPDGAEIAWSAGPGEAIDIFATAVATGATRRVTALPGRALYPAFSPDGRHLAFVHDAGGAQLRVIDSHAPTITDTARTRSLGSAEASWIGSDAFAPVWSPASEALFVPAGHEPRATLVPLAGERRELALPDVPLFASWSAGTLTWVRHDRLWRAPFHAAGDAGAATPLGASAALYASTARDGTVLFVSGDGLRVRAPTGEERALGWPIRYTPPVAPPLLLRNVRIIDGTGAPASVPSDVLIERGRITRIAPAGRIAADGTRVLDGTGRFVIPGLMDLHAHGYWPEVYPGFLHFGVTAVRDQGSAMAPIAAFADAVAAGAVPGPRTLYGGFQYYSDWAFDDEEGRGIEPEADTAHVTRAVALAEAFGAQHIKTRTFRRWDINARMIAEGHRRGLRATGHCSLQLPLVAAGMDAKEHAGSCTTRGSGGRTADAVHYDDVNQLLRAADIGFVPTISYFAFAVRLAERPDLLAGDTELAPFLPDSSSFGWMLGLDDAGRAWFQETAAGARRVAAEAVRAGVTVGTGTDIWQVPTGVHMELEELVAAGLAPLEAIRAGTLGAARIAGVDRDLGSIEPGKLADLVLLDADPSLDIRNTRRIHAVLQNGALVDRDAIRTRYALSPPRR